MLQLRDDLKDTEKNLARTNNVSLFTQFKCPLSSEADIASIEIYLEEINNYNSAVSINYNFYQTLLRCFVLLKHWYKKTLRIILFLI